MDDTKDIPADYPFELDEHGKLRIGAPEEMGVADRVNRMLSEEGQH